MPPRDTPPDRPTAAWINRYAAGLLSAAPGLRPLDAVRMAMDACGDGDDTGKRPPPKASGPQRALPRR